MPQSKAKVITTMGDLPIGGYVLLKLNESDKTRGCPADSQNKRWQPSNGGLGRSLEVVG